jgi:nitrogen fixation/metabolism regulation signal transduction histidine kinase
MFYKRSQFLINKRFQLKFAFFVCSWIFALSMIYPIIIYNLFEYFLAQFSQVQQPGQPLSLESVRNVQANVLFWLGVLQLVVLAITFMLSIFISHRIAGPLFKLRRAIDDVKGGNFDQRISFRKNDHFPELQDSFNEMVQYLSIRRR